MDGSIVFFTVGSLIIGLGIGYTFGREIGYLKGLSEKLVKEEADGKVFRVMKAAEAISKGGLVGVTPPLNPTAADVPPPGGFDIPADMQPKPEERPLVDRAANQMGSSVMKYPTPQEVRSAKEKQIEEDYLADIQINGRKSGSFVR